MINIGILTEQEYFSHLIKDLRKKGVNAKRLEIEDDFKDFAVIIVDLSYSLGQAFSFLENLNSNHHYSEKSFFAAVSKKSQLLKLRTLGLRVDGYVSPEIDVNDLLQKVEGARDPETLPKKTFNRAPLEVYIQGSLTHISESGAIISGPFKFNKGDEAPFDSDLFQELGIEEKIVSKVLNSTPAPGRTFLTEIDFVTLSDNDRDELRKLIHSWRAE